MSTVSTENERKREEASADEWAKMRSPDERERDRNEDSCRERKRQQQRDDSFIVTRSDEAATAIAAVVEAIGR